MAERITPRSQDFSQWYLDIIQHAQLADQSPVRGCLVLKPNGYALWEVVQTELNRRFKATGHKNVYFPMFIPESFLQKEKDHVEGFMPQCAVVTHGGGKKLEENLIVRPTSETIINSMYAKWVQSYRDLPILYNQWANVVRWEMRTRPFLRTIEFLWQEGHTCHETAPEAQTEMKQMLGVYDDFLRNVFAVATIAGEKSASEKFAGAETTVCLEAMMQDKKALQAATSHFFGDRFAKAFGIKFQGRDGKEAFVHQTSWGLSTRVIGALIMTHSDDQGLVLPPKAAPTQIVLVPIVQKNKDNTLVLETTAKLGKELKEKFLVHVDDRDTVSAGYKFNEWEVQGIPLRIEIGPRDLAQGMVTLARRDGKKQQCPVADVAAMSARELDDFQAALLAKSQQFLEDNTFEANDYAAFRKGLDENPGFYSVFWCTSATCEAQVKEETKATLRCIPFQRKAEKGSCIVCQKPADGRVIFARNY